MKPYLKNLRKFSLIRPGYFIAILIVVVLVMIVSSYYELRESKKEVYHLLDDYAGSLIYMIDISSANAVISDQETENLLTQHLLGVARNVRRMDSVLPVSNNLLKSVADENEVYRINIFNLKAEKIFSNYKPEPEHIQLPGKHSPEEFIGRILRGKENEIIIGLKEARFEQGNRYAVAVNRASNRGGAIVVNLDAKSYEEFKKKIGFGKIIQDIGNKSGIEYVALQNEKEIIAANKPVEGISKLNEDSFLTNAINKNVTQTRVNEFQDINVYEVVKPFNIEGETIGIFRVGLSMHEINDAESRMYRRAVIMSVILIIISVIVIGGIVSNQNYRFVSGEYKKIQTYTGGILENMGQAVITMDNDGMIKIFNKSAESMFNLKSDDVIDKKMTDVLIKEYWELGDLLIRKEQIENFEIAINSENEQTKILSVNKTINYNTNKNPDSYTIVISEITGLKAAELQKQQNEKLIAMGELASAVAHEVRNPLNSISMIAQRFDKEFTGKVKDENFKNLTGVLHSESIRVNKIVEQFLRFARPPKLDISEISSGDFLSSLKTIIDVHTKEKNISFNLAVEKDVILKIDTEQMKQAFINIIQNAIEATGVNGKIELKFYRKNNKNIFEITDNGMGIPKENLDKIFDLYYTTKTNGTGLGLSIVRQIISLHNGTVIVDIKEGKGTKFIIELPVN